MPRTEGAVSISEREGTTRELERRDNRNGRREGRVYKRGKSNPHYILQKKRTKFEGKPTYIWHGRSKSEWGKRNPLYMKERKERLSIWPKIEGAILSMERATHLIQPGWKERPRRTLDEKEQLTIYDRKRRSRIQWAKRYTLYDMKWKGQPRMERTNLNWEERLWIRKELST